jgi:hypothetical protein
LAACLRGPDDFGQALTAFSRAIRAQRRLGRLAPAFFDSTEVNRLQQRRKEEAAWRAVWEPALESVYGPDQNAPAPDPSLPQTPKCSRMRHAVERELASLDRWMSAGSLALERYERRRSRALPSVSRIARLIEIGMEFGRLACGEPAIPDDSSCARALADLERIYGDREGNQSTA